MFSQDTDALLIMQMCQNHSAISASVTLCDSGITVGMYHDSQLPSVCLVNKLGNDAGEGP